MACFKVCKISCSHDSDYKKIFFWDVPSYTVVEICHYLDESAA